MSVLDRFELSGSEGASSSGSAPASDGGSTTSSAEEDTDHDGWSRRNRNPDAGSSDGFLDDQCLVALSSARNQSSRRKLSVIEKREALARARRWSENRREIRSGCGEDNGTLGDAADNEDSGVSSHQSEARGSYHQNNSAQKTRIRDHIEQALRQLKSPVSITVPLWGVLMAGAFVLALLMAGVLLFASLMLMVGMRLAGGYNGHFGYPNHIPHNICADFHQSNTRYPASRHFSSGENGANLPQSVLDAISDEVLRRVRISNEVHGRHLKKNGNGIKGKNPTHGQKNRQTKKQKTSGGNQNDGGRRGKAKKKSKQKKRDCMEG